jgi:hypothetical protein
MFISMALLKAPNLALRRPKEHSITMRDLHKVNPKYWSCTVEPPFEYSFITYGISGYAGSPRMNTGTGSSSGMIVRFQGGIFPLFREEFKLEFENTLASCTLPGHLTTTSIKQYLKSHVA